MNQQINQIINEVLSFLLYPQITGWFLVLKFVFIFFGFFFLGFVIWALINTTWLKRAILWDLKEFLTYRPYQTKIFLPKWKKIEKRLASGIEAEAKLSIIEADSLLNEYLIKIGYTGKSLEEKLNKLTKDVILNLEEVKEAHKIRNNIVDDPAYRLNLEEAKRVLAIYENALKDLQAL